MDFYIIGNECFYEYLINYFYIIFDWLFICYFQNFWLVIYMKFSSHFWLVLGYFCHENFKSKWLVLGYFWHENFKFQGIFDLLWGIFAFKLWSFMAKTYNYRYVVGGGVTIIHLRQHILVRWIFSLLFSLQNCIKLK